jgi:hypothetical protein
MLSVVRCVSYLMSSKERNRNQTIKIMTKETLKNIAAVVMFFFLIILGLNIFMWLTEEFAQVAKFLFWPLIIFVGYVLLKGK